MTTLDIIRTINEPALRLELAIEIENKVEQRYQARQSQDHEKIAELEHLLSSVQKELASSDENTQRVVRNVELSLGKKLVEAEGLVESLRSTLKKHHDTADTMKKENAAFKALKPLELKKKLAKSKQEQKDTKLMVADLVQKRRDLTRNLTQQKREFEKLAASAENTTECFLYESSCKQFRVIGTSFESESRPMVVEHVNYRVVNMESGASFVAQLADEKVSVEEIEALPEDVLAFLDKSIRSESADDE